MAENLIRARQVWILYSGEGDWASLAAASALNALEVAAFVTVVDLTDE